MNTPQSYSFIQMIVIYKGEHQNPDSLPDKGFPHSNNHSGRHVDDTKFMGETQKDKLARILDCTNQIRHANHQFTIIIPLLILDHFDRSPNGTGDR